MCARLGGKTWLGVKDTTKRRSCAHAEVRIIARCTRRSDTWTARKRRVWHNNGRECERRAKHPAAPAGGLGFFPKTREQERHLYRAAIDRTHETSCCEIPLLLSALATSRTLRPCSSSAPRKASCTFEDRSVRSNEKRTVQGVGAALMSFLPPHQRNSRTRHRRLTNERVCAILREGPRGTTTAVRLQKGQGPREL